MKGTFLLSHDLGQIELDQQIQECQAVLERVLCKGAPTQVRPEGLCNHWPGPQPCSTPRIHFLFVCLFFFCVAGSWSGCLHGNTRNNACPSGCIPGGFKGGVQRGSEGSFLRSEE